MKPNGEKDQPTGCTAKKPYSKPEVRHEKMFETGALACTQSGAKWACSPTGHQKS